MQEALDLSFDRLLVMMMIYSSFFSLQNAVSFIILTYLVPVLFTFYIQAVLKLKKNNSGAKRLKKWVWFCSILLFLVRFDMNEIHSVNTRAGYKLLRTVNHMAKDKLK